MQGQASGRFDIETKPEGSFGGGIGRLSITKTFHGDLTGSSEGEMLAARTATEGSAGYVLIERVTGLLAQRSGSFLLQHHGLMQRGRPEATITVIPDSGTDDLAGLTGGMSIDAAADHAYRFDYTLPDPGQV